MCPEDKGNPENRKQKWRRKREKDTDWGVEGGG